MQPFLHEGVWRHCGRREVGCVARRKFSGEHARPSYWLWSMRWCLEHAVEWGGRTKEHGLFNQEIASTNSMQAQILLMVSNSTARLLHMSCLSMSHATNEHPTVRCLACLR